MKKHLRAWHFTLALQYFVIYYMPPIEKEAAFFYVAFSFVAWMFTIIIEISMAANRKYG